MSDWKIQIAMHVYSVIVKDKLQSHKSIIFNDAELAVECANDLLEALEADELPVMKARLKGPRK